MELADGCGIALVHRLRCVPEAARVSSIKRIPYHTFVRRPKLAVSVHAFTLLRASATMAVSHSSWTRKVYGVVKAAAYGASRWLCHSPGAQAQVCRTSVERVNGTKRIYEDAAPSSL